MIQRSYIEFDVHTHTIASGHAYSTLQEMAKAASEIGLKLLGITDYARDASGLGGQAYFRNLWVIPRNMYGVELLLGAEINILDTSGNLDMDDELMSRIDLRIAGIHSKYYRQGTREENTEGLVKVMRHPLIHIISHPGDGCADLDFETIVLASKEYRTLIEINNSSLNSERGKASALNNNLNLLRLCKHYEVPVILGSDAHISFDIANFKFLYPLLKEVEFPGSLVLNHSISLFKSYLGLP